MQQYEPEELPHEEDEKRQDDEEEGVPHGPVALLIDVDGPAQTDAERRRLSLRRQLRAIRLVANPARRKRSPEIGHVPLGGEPGRAGGPRLRQARTDEARVRKFGRHLDRGFVRRRKESKVPRAVQLQGEREWDGSPGLDCVQPSNRRTDTGVEQSDVDHAAGKRRGVAGCRHHERCPARQCLGIRNAHGNRRVAPADVGGHGPQPVECRTEKRAFDFHGRRVHDDVEDSAAARLRGHDRIDPELRG